MTKQLLFSVTAKDCEFIFQRGRGNGGQKKNKTNSACICKHVASGAQGYAEDSRSQSDNKSLAFTCMAETKEFKSWMKLEISKKTGEAASIEESVDRQMNPRYIRTEVKKENKWTEVNETELE
jgi:protein subunit release factor B